MSMAKLLPSVGCAVVFLRRFCLRDTGHFEITTDSLHHSRIFIIIFVILEHCLAFVLLQRKIGAAHCFMRFDQSGCKQTGNTWTLDFPK